MKPVWEQQGRRATEPQAKPTVAQLNAFVSARGQLHLRTWAARSLIGGIAHRPCAGFGTGSRTGSVWPPASSSTLQAPPKAMGSMSECLGHRVGEKKKKRLVEIWNTLGAA